MKCICICNSDFLCCFVVFFFFSSRRRHTRFDCDWSSDVCSSDLGGPIADYQIGLLQRLRRLEQTPDGVAAFNGDAAAQTRISGRVEALRDTVRVGLINGDLYTNAPYGLKPDDIWPQVQSFFFNEGRYGQLNAPQLQQLRSFTPIDSGWAGVTHSEHRVVATLRHVQSSPNPDRKSVV